MFNTLWKMLGLGARLLAYTWADGWWRAGFQLLAMKNLCTIQEL